jgi:hypothetical protein
VSPDLGDSLTSLISAEDVGLYGTLCVLSSLQRDEVRSIMVDSASTFRNFVDLDPSVIAFFFFFHFGTRSSHT